MIIALFQVISVHCGWIAVVEAGNSKCSIRELLSAYQGNNVVFCRRNPEGPERFFKDVLSQNPACFSGRAVGVIAQCPRNHPG